MTYFYNNMHYYTDPCEIGPSVLKTIKVLMVKFVINNSF
jgi:hypothetical protein